MQTHSGITLQHCTDQFKLAQRFLLPFSSLRGEIHLIKIISEAQSDVRVVQEVYASVVDSRSVLCGRSKRLWQSWCGW